MIDRNTLDKWRGEFCVLMAYEDVDLTLLIGGGGARFVIPDTARLWRYYRDGRMQERAAAACVLEQVRIHEVLRVVDCQDVSYRDWILGVGVSR